MSACATGVSDPGVDEPDADGERLGAAEPDGVSDGEVESIDVTLAVSDGDGEEEGRSDGLRLGFTGCF